MNADDRRDRAEPLPGARDESASTAQVQRTAFERQDGATEINPATTSAAETSESHPDPSFVAMLEQFRDATLAEQFFSQGPQEKL